MIDLALEDLILTLNVSILCVCQRRARLHHVLSLIASCDYQSLFDHCDLTGRSTLFLLRLAHIEQLLLLELGDLGAGRRVII